MRERLNFRRRPILCTTLYRNLMQAPNFGGIFDQLFLWIFSWNFHRKCLSTFSIPWCKKVKNDQKLKSRGSCLNASKCGVLVVGQKKRGKLWRLGKEGIKEVEDYKYLGVWINRQVNGHNHEIHLEWKALGLQYLARGGKFWRDEEDIKAGLTMWEVVCKPVLNYGAEVWACSSKADEQGLERILNRAGRRILGVSWRFHGVVVGGELGWRKLKYDRHRLALQYVGRLRGMGWERWPKIVGEALSRIQNKETWVDYVRSLVARYQLQTCWEDEGWNEKVWKKAVVDQVEKKESGLGEKKWREDRIWGIIRTGSWC